MDERDREIISGLRRRISEEGLSGLKRLIVFGSRARGEAPEDSDLDIVALVAEKTPEIEKKLGDIVYQVMWDYDFTPIISLKIFSESRFKEAFKKGFSFYRSVEEQGVSV